MDPSRGLPGFSSWFRRRGRDARWRRAKDANDRGEDQRPSSPRDGSVGGPGPRATKGARSGRDGLEGQGDPVDAVERVCPHRRDGARMRAAAAPRLDQRAERGVVARDARGRPAVDPQQDRVPAPHGEEGVADVELALPDRVVERQVAAAGADGPPRRSRPRARSTAAIPGGARAARRAPPGSAVRAAPRRWTGPRGRRRARPRPPRRGRRPRRCGRPSGRAPRRPRSCRGARAVHRRSPPSPPLSSPFLEARVHRGRGGATHSRANAA